jgi:hypothetical protein
LKIDLLLAIHVVDGEYGRGQGLVEAASVLDKEIFNAEIESEWRAHFAVLTDEELLGVDTELLFRGLRDRIERVRRAYGQEIARRTKTSHQ